MEPSTTPNPTPPAEPKKRRGCFGLLFKSALGCTAFAIGSLIALVLLLPMLCGSLVGSLIEKGFHQRFRGSLAVGKVDLAWTQPQTVQDVVLLTPEKTEVGRVSLTLPPLLDLARSGGSHFGRVVVHLNADLVADDAGITNLERALEPTGLKPKDERVTAEVNGDPAAEIAALDLDLEISSQRLSWSDAETRRVGAPFEIRDFTASLKARPGQPIAAHAHGQIVSDAPGELVLDAQVHDLLRKEQKWPWGRIDVKLAVKGFSSAMLDGIANQHGRLKELLGPRFDLTLNAIGATPDAGDVVLALDSDAMKVNFSGRFEGGAFHLSNAPDQGITLPLPRGYIDAFATPHLPPGAKLVFGSGSKQPVPKQTDPNQADAPAKPWTLRVQKLDLPIPDLGARDMKSLAPYLERLVCDVSLDLPGTIGLESSSLPPGSASPMLRGTRLGLHAAPKDPVVLGLTAELEMNGKSNVGAEITLRDPWKALASGALPHADAHVEITDFGTAALDALAQQNGKLAGALGPKISIRLKAADVSTDSGTFSLELGAEHLEVACSGKLEQGRVRCSGVDALTVRAEPPAAWLDAEIAAQLPPGLEIGVSPGPIKLEVRDVTFVLPTGPKPAGDALALVRGALAAQLSCDLPGLHISNESTRAAKLPIELGATHAVLSLALDGKCALALKTALDTGTKGNVSVTLNTADAWKLARADFAKDPPPIDARIVLDGLSTSAIDRLVGRENFTTDLLGPSVSLTLDARDASLKSGSVRLDVVAPRAKLAFAGKLDGGSLRCAGQDGLDLDASPSSDFVARELGPFLPAGTKIVLAESHAAAGAQTAASTRPLRLTLRDALLPLPDFASTAKLGKPEITALIERAFGKLRLDIGRLEYSDPRTQASKIAVALDALVLNLDFAPKQPLVLKLDSGVEAGGKGVLAAEVDVKDPWLVLKSDAAKLPPIDAKLKLGGFPSATIDAFAGEKEMFTKLFGPAIDIDATATGMSLEQGSFALDVKSPTTLLKSSGRLEKGALVCSGTQGLDLSLHLPPDWLEDQISRFLPAGSRLSTPSDASPLTLVVRDVRAELPKASGGTIGEQTGDASPGNATTGASKSSVGTSNASSGNPKASGATAKKPSQGDVPPAIDGTAAVASADDSKRAMLLLVSKLALRANLTVPTLSYADATTDAAKQPVSIRDLTAAIDLVPGKPPSATLRAKIQAETPGELNFNLRALDPLEKLADEKGLDTFRIYVDVSASHVPTALVDALAGQNGLLVDALGPRLEMSVKSESLSREQGSFVAALSSDEHSMHLVEGHFDHGDLVIDKDGGLVAKVGLTPLVSQRLVGNLVPMLVDVQKPQGSEPAVFSVDSLRWPKDNDIGKLDAVVRVNLGDVTYRLLPGLEAVFGTSVPKSVKMPELRVPIQKGVASYTGLPIKIAGRDFVFKGSFNLKDQTFNLGTDVPLGLLGKNVEKQLDSLRGVLSPDMLVPVEIRGTWKSPRVGIGNDFLKHVVEDAAKKELPGLLDGLLKKKKKD